LLSHPLHARPTWSRSGLQVGRAFEYLRRAEDADRPDVRYEVGVRRAGGAARARGVYLREPLDALRPVSFTADVRPRLHEASASLAAYYLQHKAPLSLLHNLVMYVFGEAREPLDALRPVSLMPGVRQWPRAAGAWLCSFLACPGMTLQDAAPPGGHDRLIIHFTC